ncbi:SDR family oxidoreductase [Novosphingobium sp. G106]|uniref:SDR family NAD(P)-dependent oxidoreductase n=1 Tax=Novosphingobium sp. G106 TaxID=2849500 RepID=UPI001C2DA048|nr:SDR family oxidoreductase [Novosphingobium sp. G106]MBV1688738.1 SDR family oxidoreductase [Novosphingobium sp. G106]
MANELAGKVAIVTGGSRGLGRGMVELFVEEGAKVVIADLLEYEGRELASQIGDGVRFRKTDVSSRDDVQGLIDFAVSEFGGLHALVNNAGLSDNAYGSLLEADFDAFERVMAVNVKGVMLGTQIAARHMANNGGGSITNVSSISGIQPGFGFFNYRASKAAVVNFTQTAAIELGVNLIRVNCICPGNIPTPMGTYAASDDDEQARRIQEAVAEVRMGWQPLKRQGSPRDIAEAALFLASDRSRQVSGQVLSVDGAATAGMAKSLIAEIMEARARVEAQ